MATIIEAIIESNIGSVKKDIDKATTSTEKLGKAAKKSGGSFNALKTAVKGIGTAMKAAGIGLFVALMAKLMEVFSKNQKTVDAFNTAMTALDIAFNDLFSFLSDNVGKVTGFFKQLFEDPVGDIKAFGNAIWDNLVERFNSLLDTFGHLGSALKHLMEGEFGKAFDSVKDAGKEVVDVYTGVDNSVDRLIDTTIKGAKAIKEYATETVNQAKAVTASAKAALFAQAKFAELNASFLKQAEEQRQIRDDETKTFAERIKANEELSAVLEKQQKLQREQIQVEIDAAEQQLRVSGRDEDRLAVQEAKNAMLELEEAITGQLSEQKTNQVSLEKELLETQRTLRAESLEGIERELEELKTAYEQKLEMARKAGVDTAAITKIYEKQKTDIVNTEAKKQEVIEKAKEDMRKQMVDQGLQIIGDAAGEGTAMAKAAAIAQATISGVQGVQNAFTAANANIGATAGSFGVYPVTMAALAGTFAAMNIAKIAAGSPASTSSTPPPSPQSQGPSPQMMSGAFELGGGIKPEPMKAFVVTDEMTNSQNQLANIRRRATI